MNRGPICAKVYPEGIQPIKGNNCGLIPVQTPQNAASDQGLCYLITVISMQNIMKMKTFYEKPLKLVMVSGWTNPLVKKRLLRRIVTLSYVSTINSKKNNV